MQPLLSRLTNKVAIITGAGSSGPGVGTGKAIAILFARAGAKVLLVDRLVQNAQETCAEILAEGGDAAVFAGDVTSAADCQAMVEAVVTRYGGLHILVNNVGITAGGTVVDVSEEAWDRVFAVNLKSMMLTSKYAIPQMMAAGGGSIINMGSVEGLRSGAFSPLAAYAASKGGVAALTTAMAVQHGRQGIRVNCIAPGFIYTPLVAPHVNEEGRALRREAAPLGTEGTAWDVAWAALFLASDEARWITGVVLPVDGGLMTTTPLSTFPYLRQVGQ